MSNPAIQMSTVSKALTIAMCLTLASPMAAFAGPVGNRALKGAIVGAAIGEITNGDPAKGAAIGAGVGVIAGAIKDNNRRDRIRHRGGKHKVKHRR